VCVCCGARDSWVTVPAHSREKSPAFALRILRRCVVSRRPSLSIGPTKQRQCMTTSIQNLTTYGIRSNSRRQDCFISSTLQIPSLKPKAQNLVVSKATTFVSWKLRAYVCVCDIMFTLLVYYQIVFLLDFARHSHSAAQWSQDLDDRARSSQ
jgi:hypothetical protein